MSQFSQERRGQQNVISGQWFFLFFLSIYQRVFLANGPVSLCSISSLFTRVMLSTKMILCTLFMLLYTCTKTSATRPTGHFPRPWKLKPGYEITSVIYQKKTKNNKAQVCSFQWPRASMLSRTGVIALTDYQGSNGIMLFSSKPTTEGCTHSSLVSRSFLTNCLAWSSFYLRSDL